MAGLLQRISEVIARYRRYKRQGVSDVLSLVAVPRPNRDEQFTAFYLLPILTQLHSKATFDP